MNSRMRHILFDEWQGTSLPDEQAFAPADLRSTFHQAFKRLGLAERLRESTLTEAWLEMVGPTIAAHSHPRKIYRGALQITVDHSAWLHQITMVHKKNILHAVQTRFPHLQIKDLALRVGPIH